MASPHVAGAAVLVKQYLQATYPTKSPQEIEALVKHLLMSTAKAHVNKETTAYTSLANKVQVSSILQQRFLQVYI